MWLKLPFRGTFVDGDVALLCCTEQVVFTGCDVWILLRLVSLQLIKLYILQWRFHPRQLADQRPIDRSSLQHVAISITHDKETQLLNKLKCSNIIFHHIIKSLFIQSC